MATAAAAAAAAVAERQLAVAAEHPWRTMRNQFFLAIKLFYFSSSTISSSSRVDSSTPIYRPRTEHLQGQVK